MGKASDEPSTGWQSAEVALEPWFESEDKFDELRKDVRTLIERAMMPELWDLSSPRRRRNLASQYDCDRHPALSCAREAVWKRAEALRELESLENTTPTDFVNKRKTLPELRSELSNAEAALKREAKGLGLNWPYDEALHPAVSASGPAKLAKKTPPRYSKLLYWWKEVYLPKYRDPETRPNAETQRRDAAEYFTDFAAPSSKTMQRLRADESTPSDWRGSGRRTKSN